MESDFEKGIKYERLSSSSFRYLLIGWTLVIVSPIWFFFSVWDFSQRFWGLIVLLGFGLLTLSVGYSERKEMKK